MGALPPKFAKLNMLFTLDLSNNPPGLTTLPDWIFTLGNITKLNLANTGIKGQLPKRISSPLTIVELDLSNNELTGKLPLWVVNMMSSLNSLDLHSKELSGSIDENISNMPGMSYVCSLILSDNPLGGSIPKSIGNLTHLTELKMEGNGVRIKG